MSSISVVKISDGVGGAEWAAYPTLGDGRPGGEPTLDGRMVNSPHARLTMAGLVATKSLAKARASQVFRVKTFQTQILAGSARPLRATGVQRCSAGVWGFVLTSIVRTFF